MTTHREIIATLLEWWEDLEHGWQDGTASEPFGYPRVNAILFTPPYLELKRQLAELYDRDREAHWNVVQRYYAAPHVQVLRCSGCVKPPRDRVEAMVRRGLRHPKDETQRAFRDENGQRNRRYHTHAQRSLELQPVQVRYQQNGRPIQPELVLRGIERMEAHWRGEPYLPNFEARVA